MCVCVFCVCARVHTRTCTHTQITRVDTKVDRVMPSVGLMDIREQLKIEWLTDLPVMKEEDAMFLYQVSVLSYLLFPSGTG